MPCPCGACNPPEVAPVTDAVPEQMPLALPDPDAAPRWRTFLAWVRVARENQDAPTVRALWERALQYHASMQPGYAVSRLQECDDCSQAVYMPATQQAGNRFSSRLNNWRAESMIACSNCDNCRDCCSCVTCSSCDQTFSQNARSVCSVCDTCERCCTCVHCSNCSNECSDSQCSGCDNCSSCCECRRGEVEFFEQPIRFHPVTSPMHRRINTSPRFISAEIEVSDVSSDDGISSTVRRWGGSIVEDGSIGPPNGFEIYTAPAAGDHFMKQIAEIGRALSYSDAEASRKCGLHIHVDARDVHADGIARLMRLYAAWESFLYQLLEDSRSSSGGYCAPNGYRLASTLDAPYTTHKDLRKRVARAVYGRADTRTYRCESKPGCRYVGLNVHPWFYRNDSGNRQGTIECRMAHGTVSADEIQSWGQIWARLVDLADSITDKECAAIIGRSSGGNVCNAYETFNQWIVAGNAQIERFIGSRVRSYGSAELREHVVRSQAGKVAL